MIDMTTAHIITNWARGYTDGYDHTTAEYRFKSSGDLMARYRRYDAAYVAAYDAAAAAFATCTDTYTSTYASGIRAGSSDALAEMLFDRGVMV